MELYGSFSKRRADDRMRADGGPMDRASNSDFAQSRLVVLGTTCHSGGRSVGEEGVEH